MSGSVAVGVVGAHGLSKELTDQLADDLPHALGQRHGNTEWQVCVREVAAAEPSADSSELFESVRGRLLTEGWDLALGLTELPLRSGKRPIPLRLIRSDQLALYRFQRWEV